MKIINYDILNEKDQKKEKGIILEKDDKLHVIRKEPPHTEIIIICNDKSLKIVDKKKRIICKDYPL